MEILNVLERKDALRYLPRYLTVGLVGTCVDLGIFSALRLLLGLPAISANTVSYSAGILINYTLHRQWTYMDRPRRAVYAQFSQFATVSLGALLINNLLLLLLAHPLALVFQNSGSGDLLAKVCATGVSMCWNFAVNNLWTFAKTAPAGED